MLIDALVMCNERRHDTSHVGSKLPEYLGTSQAMPLRLMQDGILTLLFSGNSLTSSGYSYFGQHAFYGSTASLKDYTDQLKQVGYMDFASLATAIVPTAYVVMTGVLHPDLCC